MLHMTANHMLFGETLNNDLVARWERLGIRVIFYFFEGFYIFWDNLSKTPSIDNLVNFYDCVSSAETVHLIKITKQKLSFKETYK